MESGILKGNGGKKYKEHIPKDDHDMVIYLANMMNGALAMVRGQPYKVEQSVGLYATSACSDDYAYSRHIKHKNDNKVYSFTIEFGEQYTPRVKESLVIRRAFKHLFIVLF